MDKILDLPKLNQKNISNINKPNAPQTISENREDGCQWLTPVILVTWKAESREIMV
jgi:hypothetical protein